MRRCPSMSLATVVIATLAAAATLALASSGDRLYDYQRCLGTCVTRCATAIDDNRHWILRLTFWSCEDNCGYDCMFSTTTITLPEVHQFHGKWPFKRVLGMQEPASVVFSILNGLMHWRGFRRISRTVPRRSRYKSLYMWNAGIAVHAWFWSTIYHYRDFWWTERLDYFTAISSVGFACYVAIIRSFNLIDDWRATRFVGSLFAWFFVLHCTYLSLWRFDYTYNMIAGVALGLSANILWITHCFRHIRDRPYGWKMIVMVVGLNLAMSLELFDFPPVWWTFDAHSCWHGATVPLVMLYQGFFRDDAAFDASDKGEKRLL